MNQTSIIELYKENMKFSAGHFTIFSETEREKMHGHNYTVHAALTTQVKPLGLSFDYRVYKQKIYALCRQLNGRFLLPEHSPYLKITPRGLSYDVRFAAEEFLLPQSDVYLMPLVNITVEELSRWFIEKLLEDENELKQNAILAITVKVFSGPGQCGSAGWEWRSQ